MKDILSDPIKFASLIAHQLKGPVSSINALLHALLGEFAGPLTSKQKDLLERGITRSDEALVAAGRLLAIARSVNGSRGFEGSVDLPKVVRTVAIPYIEAAHEHNIKFSCDIGVETAFGRGDEEAVSEALDAILSNALKYTPDNGEIEVSLTVDELNDRYQVRVADSGIGIPQSNYDKVFEPFYRTPGAHASSRPGTGLGLSFVKAIVEASGGSVEIEKSRFGGAELIVNFAVSQAKPEPGISEETQQKPEPMKVVIIGGVAAGPKVAAKVIRLDPHADVTIVERGRLMSYAGCGLPYYISGVVKEQSELMSSPAGDVRDPVFFQKVKNIHVLNQTEALEIDRDKKQVRIKRLVDNSESLLRYDKLVLATGSRPVLPDIEGIHLRNIFTLHGVTDAEGIKARLEQGKARDVAVIGGGLIAIEMTEALVNKGCRVTIIEKASQILGILDFELARLVENHLESKAVRVLTDIEVKALGGDEEVDRVITDHGDFPVDMVVVAVGNEPEITLAKDCGLEIGPAGAIKVTDQMQTADPDIYAAGDCTECTNIITGQSCYMPLGSTANKQGRVAAVNICGGQDKFPGILGTFACKVFDYNVAVTGLTQQKAKELGHDVITVLVPSPDREQFVPGVQLVLLKLLVDAESRKLLGAQATGPGQGDKRIDVAVAAITAGMTVDQLANLDLCYAPPFSLVMDNIITAANVARNKLDGYMTGISPIEVYQMIKDKKDFTLLDVRTPHEYRTGRLEGSKLIPLASLRARYLELDSSKPIVVFCNYSLRAYEAAFILKTAGCKDIKVMDGGLEMWPYEKI